MTTAPNIVAPAVDLPASGPSSGSPFRFVVGEMHQTQAGQYVKIIGRTTLKGYECLICSDGRYRYDRSTHDSDAGRVTGTDHGYRYAHNLKRDDRP